MYRISAILNFYTKLKSFVLNIIRYKQYDISRNISSNLWTHFSINRKRNILKYYEKIFLKIRENILKTCSVLLLDSCKDKSVKP